MKHSKSNSLGFAGACALALLVSGVSCFAAQPVKIVGSDIVGHALRNAAQRSMRDVGASVSFDMQGSYPAISKLASDEADLGIIAVPKGKPKPEGYIAIPVLHHAAIVAVNGENPVEDLSLKQLSDIFAKKTTSRIDSWDKVSKNASFLRAIQPMATNFTDNLVVEIFKNTALNRDDFGPWVSVIRDKKDAVNIVGTGASVVMVLGKAASSSRVKVLSISSGADNGDYAFKPTNETIHNGDYPMVLTFYIVFKREKSDLLKPVVKALLSDDTARNIDDGDFYSVPKNFRKRYILELDTLK